jgi:hypothetical protein
MGKSQTTKPLKDFLILGPTLVKGNKVLEAIHSLYYLPENYKMVFTGTSPVDQNFYSQIVSLIERDSLADRVRFMANVRTSDAVIDPKATVPTTRKIVTGDSAEAFASAILNLTRVPA